ncbi:MAG: amidohydrolase family protein [Candidatus Cyclobacteriaceae bacterium M3_2C_046]
MKKYLYIVCLMAIPLVIRAQDSDQVDHLYLRDYHPESIYQIPKTHVSQASYPVIDMHSHPYAKSEESLKEWVKTMDQAGIDKTILLTYAHGRRFDSLVQVYQPYADKFDLWCGFDYTGYDKPGYGPAAVAELERCYKMGARGVGELGDKGKGLFYSKPPAWGMHPDHKKMDMLFSKCAELGMPVNIHVAEPKWMYEKMDASNDGLMNAYKWRLDNQSDIIDHGGMIDILARTLEKHPGTTFIACHYANCSYDLDKVGQLLDQYPNLYLDISARYGEVAAIPRHTSQFIKNYQDRLLYGTDLGTSLNMYQFTFRILETADEHIYHDYNPYHWPLHGLDLEDEILQKVYRLNALKIIN